MSRESRAKPYAMQSCFEVPVAEALVAGLYATVRMKPGLKQERNLEPFNAQEHEQLVIKG
jgi:hypothetical protein